MGRLKAAPTYELKACGPAHERQSAYRDDAADNQDAAAGACRSFLAMQLSILSNA